jgi:signal transduction histidine kinase
LERLVAERTSTLREAIAQMEEFSYTVSHDLRAPLRALRLYAGVLLENFASDLPEEAQECLGRIDVNANSLEKMVGDVLTFSKVARSDMPMGRVATDRLVRNIVDRCPTISHCNATIEVETLPDVLGNEPSLTQAFSNLLSNAVKFVAPGVRPFVRVWSEPHGEKIRFWVSDNGIGIDPKYHARLFSMFERIHPDLVYEGTGVGLAIVRKAVERMGGKVGVESAGTHGSRFWMELQAGIRNENPVKQHNIVGRG